MENTNLTSPSSVNGRIVTPRRQLSYVCVDEQHTTPESPCEDKGYGSRISSVSSTSSCSTYRVPLGEIYPLPQGGNVRRTLQAKRSVGKPPSESSESFQNNENVAPDRPSSLPTLSPPVMPGDHKPTRAESLSRQISSPMSRMRLMSPKGFPQSSRPPSTASSDGYLSEVFDKEELENPAISSELSSLISGSAGPTPMTCQISHKNEVVRPTPLRPSGLFQEDHESAFATSAATKDQRRGSLKRSSPMGDINVAHCGKRRPLPFSNSEDSPPSTTKFEQEVTFKRSQSCSMASESIPFSPIGDFSKPYALPLVQQHSDLKYISADTLCDLLSGEFEDLINRYTIIDCRFSYEYEGGHVRGATNICTEEDLLEKFFPKSLQYPQVREVIVLYCEFSSRRGPKMSRFLRGTDRKKNGELFPKLFYPEVYLLHRGYSTFFAAHPKMCDPMGYVPMAPDDNVAQYRKAKAKIKRSRQHHH